MSLTEAQRKFLEIVSTANWKRPPPVWNQQFREALSEGYVKVGWGGRLELSDLGRLALTSGREK